MMYDEPVKTIGWDFSAEYLDVEPTIDDPNPLRVLCIKEQCMVNGKPNGEPRYYQVAREIQYDTVAVNRCMQALANSHKRMLGKLRSR